MIQNSLSSDDLVELYADARSTVERIEERLLLSPVADAWKIRMAVAERAALASMDGQHFDISDVRISTTGAVSPSPFDLTRCQSALGQFISLAALANEPTTILNWLGIDQDVGSFGEILERVEMWQRQCSALPPSPHLLHSAALAYLWRQIRPLEQGDTVASSLIGDRWGAGRWKGSIGGLTAVGLELDAYPWKIATLQEFKIFWLKAIASGARAHLDTETRLRVYRARVAAVLDGRRKSAGLQAVIFLAMSRIRIDSRLVAQSLDLTPAGAINLLNGAIRLGLLIERSGRSSYRSYSIPVT